MKTLSVFESGKIKTLYLELAIKGTVSYKLCLANSLYIIFIIKRAFEKMLKELSNFMATVFFS